MTENENMRDTTRRGKTLALLVMFFGAAALIYALWWFFIGSRYESTDDAYVAGNVVQITPQVAGTVVAIHADDTAMVRAGQELVVLDRADAQVALDQAEAELARAVRDVRTLFASNAALEANVALRESEVARAQEDFKRREALVSSGAVAREEMEHVRNNVQAAQAALLAAREQLASNRALIDATTVETHPNVLHAASRVREAWLALARTSIPAPITGQIAKRSVQLGQRVQPGMPMMAVVPLDHLWVDANFKEVQLRKMRIGQPATIEADLYGGRIEYHGKIVGLAAGTGSAFSLLPAQNATGNWIKVVQRVPVRIELDREEIARHPLRIGLSMIVKVDVSNQEGSQLAAVATTQEEPAYATDVFKTQAELADALVRKIIGANLGTGRGEGPSLPAPVKKRVNHQPDSSTTPRRSAPA